MDIDGQGKQGEIPSLPLLYYLLQCTFYFRSPPASVGKKEGKRKAARPCLVSVKTHLNVLLPCPSVQPRNGAGPGCSKEEEQLLGTPHDYDIDGHPDDTLSRA